MRESFDKAAITRLLSELDRKDRHRSVFGSSVHDYKLHPPIQGSTIEEFEAQHGIRLPDDYRYFITEIGNGGAGPYYGLFPFGQQDDELSWEEGDLVGDVSRPFPHVEAWNLPESFWQQEPDISPDTPRDEEDRLWEAWDKVEQKHYWNPAIMNGAIPISHLGCALRQWLVVNGEQKGFVWNDFRADHRGISPLRNESGRQMSFSDWYVSWLDESLRTLGFEQTIVSLLVRGERLRAIQFYQQEEGADPEQAERAVEAIAVRHRVATQTSRSREVLTLLGLIVAGVLLGLAMALLRK
jgi:hypothetical protein